MEYRSAKWTFSFQYYPGPTAVKLGTLGGRMTHLAWSSSDRGPAVGQVPILGCNRIDHCGLRIPDLVDAGNLHDFDRSPAQKCGVERSDLAVGDVSSVTESFSRGHSSSIITLRVIPSRANSAVGVNNAFPLTKNTFEPLDSHTASAVERKSTSS